MKKLIVEFLKPDWKKILILIVVMGIIFWFQYFYRPEMVAPFFASVGFPLIYFTETFAFIPPETIQGTTFSIANFVIDLIFWYLLSCLIIFSYNKFKGRKK